MKESDAYLLDPNVVDVIIDEMVARRDRLRAAERRIERLRAALLQAAGMKTIAGARIVAADALRADDEGTRDQRL